LWGTLTTSREEEGQKLSPPPLGGGEKKIRGPPSERGVRSSIFGGKKTDFVHKISGKIFSHERRTSGFEDATMNLSHKRERSLVAIGINVTEKKRGIVVAQVRGGGGGGGVGWGGGGGGGGGGCWGKRGGGGGGGWGGGRLRKIDEKTLKKKKKSKRKNYKPFFEDVGETSSVPSLLEKKKKRLRRTF